MASGKEHHKSNKRIMLITIIPFVLYDGLSGLLVTFGLFLSLLVTPDLDQHQITTHSESLLIKYNKLVGWLFVLYWKPYSHFYKHRCFMSHAPIISTLFRVSYLIPVWFPVVYYFNIDVVWVIRVCIGMAIGDINHFRMDGIRSCLSRWVSDFNG